MLSLLLVLFIQSASAADTAQQQPHQLDADLLRLHTTYFDIRDYRILQADTLLALTEQSQFVALGEIHNSRRLSQFTDALMRHLSDYGFRHLAVETGPWSAEKLQQLASSGREELSEFYGRWSSKLFNIYPVPFFTGEADLNFLMTADSLEYDLWGVDQEFYYSVRYLLDELVTLNRGGMTDETERIHSRLQRRLYWWYRRAAVFSGFPLNCRLQQDKDLIELLTRYDRENPENNRIVTALEKTLEIYCLSESGEWNRSNRMRIDYFEELFDRQYEAAVRTDSLPRVILKMGSYHSGRARSPLGLPDLGNHLHNLSQINGTQSIHLRFLNRYFEDEEDYIGRDGWTSSTRFMQTGELNRWALIDLRELRTMLENGELTATDFETREILNYDFMIIMPEDRKVEKHY